MAPTLLQIQDKGDVVVASFNEKKIVDVASVQQLEKEFHALAQKAAAGRKLVLDFSQVTFISSMTIGLIVRLHSECKRNGIRLKLCGLAPEVLEVFKITGLRKVLDIHADEAKALEGFAPAAAEWEAGTS